MGDRSRRGARHGVHASAIVLICAVLAACSTGEVGQYGQKEAQGQEMGSIIGGIVAPYIPGSSVAAQIVRNNGDLIGGIIGGAIGAALDEEDRKALEKSTREALASGKTKTFANRKTGVQGTVKVTGSRVNDEGRQCRTVQQDVKLKDGSALKDTVSACKGPNGWEV
jgi:surface antigen